MRAKIAALICAVIDIGSNTTRLLVAELGKQGLAPLTERRAYTAIAAASMPNGTIPQAKLDEVAAVVTQQKAAADRLGCERLRVVATAALREAPNGLEAAARIGSQAAVEVELLSPGQEGDFAFSGATRMDQARGYSPADHSLTAVVDVGGGSSELVIGTPGEQVSWMRSLAIGSSTLTSRFGGDDPPSRDAVAAMVRGASELVGRLDPPPVDEAIAVGGSATALTMMLGRPLDRAGLNPLMLQFTAGPAEDVARIWGIDSQRIRLMPAGIALLSAFADLLAVPLRVGGGGLREGVLLEMGHSEG